VHPVEIQGQRVRLREFRTRDGAAVHAWASDPEVVRFIPLGPTTPSGARRLVRQYRASATTRPRVEYSLAVIPAADPADTAVGTIALTIDSAVHRRGEIGYALRRDQWGRGLASEAVRLVLELGFDRLGLERIWAVCDPDNLGSIRVLERAGLRYEGRLRGDLLVHGQRRDSLLYAVLGSDRPRPTYL
jgi:[ribosomal protein S5]-alanine N-acetyltransferase